MDAQVLHIVEEENLCLVKRAHHTPPHGYIVRSIVSKQMLHELLLPLPSLAHYFANLCLHL